MSKANVPPGALISFLQKGLQYVGIEETLRQDGTDRTSHMNGVQDIDFTLLSPHSIKALTRKNPPIKLNVPPATAAAAIKARLESDAKAQQASANANATTNATTSTSTPLNHHHANNTNGSSNINLNGPLSTPQAVAPGQIPASVNHTNQQIAQVMMQQRQVGSSGVSGGPAAAVATSVFANGYTSMGDESKAAVAAALVQCGTQATAMEIDGGSGSGGQGTSTTTSNSNSRALASTVAGAMHASAEAEAVAALLSGKAQGQVLGQIQPDSTPSIPQQDAEIEREDMLSRASPDEVLELNKHTSEVFMCAWNPVFTDLLATGSGDASARIWKMGGKNAKGGSDICRLLPHGTNSSDKKNKDVTTLEWSSNGELLATGSYDGVARVWGRTGAIVHTLTRHIGPIFSLKWNKSGKFLLSGSYDKTTIVWDVSGDVGMVKQQFSHHTAPALDVDWKDDVTFASCSTDKTVAICKVGSSAPLHEFRGHNDEVNAVKWDPSGTLLASCSDDSTAKVWDASSGSSEPLYDFTSHKQEIYTVKWCVCITFLSVMLYVMFVSHDGSILSSHGCIFHFADHLTSCCRSPTGPCSKNPDKPRMLATASFDSTVRLWNVQNGACIAVLSRHRESVYSVAFSPSGDYLASGSLAGQLYVWRVKDGKHIKNFKGKGDIFEVAWNKEESRIAACFSSNVVNVIDFKA